MPEVCFPKLAELLIALLTLRFSLHGSYFNFFPRWIVYSFRCCMNFHATVYVLLIMVTLNMLYCQNVELHIYAYTLDEA